VTDSGRRWLVGAALAAALAVIAFPLWMMAVGSVTREAQLFQGAVFLPHRPVFDHYRALLAERGFWRPLRNSLVVAGVTTLICVGLGSVCAYALARLRFRGRGVVLGFVLAVGTFPQISIVSPLYLLLRRVGLIDTYPGLILPYVTFAMPLAVWVLAGFFRELPAEIEEAARVDGASRLRTLAEVVLPMAAPALATTAILTFIYCWNEFLFALSFTLGPDHQTVPVAIALLRGRYQVSWGQILAAALLSTAPVAAGILVFQRRIVQGLVSGAVKG
jgi:ABC-type glycerol-3-phosphate transport system permease component